MLEGVAVRDGVAETVGVRVTGGVPDDVAVVDWLGVLEAVWVALGVTDCVAPSDGDSEGVAVMLAVLELAADTEDVCEAVLEALLVWDAVALRVGVTEDVRLGT